MLDKTQKKWVIEQLRYKGSITRNECLRKYISRLGAIIYQLKEDGWEFEGYYFENNQGKDFVYRVKNKPEEEKKRNGKWVRNEDDIYKFVF